MKLKGKSAIVTGASSGMGRAIAYEYAREGANVLAIARRRDKLDELVLSAGGLEGRIVAYEGDVTALDTISHIFDEAIRDFGKVDILVNNAGIMDDFSGVGQVEEEMYARVFDINVKAPLFYMKEAVNYFKEVGGGIIINIASIGGLNGGIAGAVYTASKHALVGLSRNTAYMYGKENIRCNTICPGSVETEVGQGEFMQHIDKDGIECCGAVHQLIPKVAKSEAIATIAVFLASDDSAFINGQNIVADGGWTAAF
ncbi:MAG: 3-ketoacyl-ACP reductase [delta proteobacterium ML8_F1]|nr:MAG: 3-ketoacyl-ACP reductase [delta proteobacterium ML8_F1]